MKKLKLYEDFNTDNPFDDLETKLQSEYDKIEKVAIEKVSYIVKTDLNTAVDNKSIFTAFPILDAVVFNPNTETEDEGSYIGIFHVIINGQLEYEFEEELEAVLEEIGDKYPVEFPYIKRGKSIRINKNGSYAVVKTQW